MWIRLYLERVNHKHPFDAGAKKWLTTVSLLLGPKLGLSERECRGLSGNMSHSSTTMAHHEKVSIAAEYMYRFPMADAERQVAEG